MLYSTASASNKFFPENGKKLGNWKWSNIIFPLAISWAKTTTSPLLSKLLKHFASRSIPSFNHFFKWYRVVRAFSEWQTENGLCFHPEIFPYFISAVRWSTHIRHIFMSCCDKTSFSIVQDLSSGPFVLNSQIYTYLRHYLKTESIINTF